jgi:hypothetical protein
MKRMMIVILVISSCSPRIHKEVTKTKTVTERSVDCEGTMEVTVRTLEFDKVPNMKEVTIADECGNLLRVELYRDGRLMSTVFYQ